MSGEPSYLETMKADRIEARINAAQNEIFKYEIDRLTYWTPSALNEELFRYTSTVLKDQIRTMDVQTAVSRHNFRMTMLAKIVHGLELLELQIKQHHELLQ